MSEAYAGGCACGAIRYNVVGEPIAATFVTYPARAYDWDRVDPASTSFAKMAPGPQ